MKVTKFGTRKIWRTLTVVLSAVLVVISSVFAIMNKNAKTINGALNITDSKIVNLGEDENVDALRFKSAYSTKDEVYEANKKIAKELEAEGAVLLKNDNNALPLARGSKVSLFSRSSVDVGYGGTGSGSVQATIDMKTALENGGKFSVNPTLWKAYSDYEAPSKKRVSGGFMGGGKFYLLEAPMSVYTNDVRASYSAYNDAAIVTLTRVGGEGADCVPGKFEDGEKYLALQDVEKEMLNEVKANFNKIIVLINSSNAMEVDWLDEYDVDACLWVGGYGQEGLHALADILVGDTNPSGRLPDIYAADSFSSPAMQNFGDFTYANAASMTELKEIYGTESTYNKYLVYKEGIYVGYKYYETRYEDCILNRNNANSSKGVYASSGNWNYSDEVSYPFGYGLSYTTFTQTLDGVTESEDGFTATVTVKNTGDRAGKSVVEIYAQTPYTAWDASNGIEKSAIQLVGFEKTESIPAGGSATVTVEVDKYDMATYDNKVNKGYILEAGDYYLALGNDSHDALNNVLARKNASGMKDADGNSVSGDKDKAYRWTLSSTDSDKFMYSANKFKVTNRFDDLDLNYYGNFVTYLTRSDWNTFPETMSTLTATAQMIEDLKPTYEKSNNSDTSEFKTEQDNGLTLASLIGTDYDDPLWDKLIDQMSIDELMTAVARACKVEILSIGKPLNYLKDGPQAITGNASSGGGLYYDDYVGNAMLGTDTPSDTPTVAYTSEVVAAATWNKELVYRLGEAFGEDGLWSIVHHHYAPGANIHRTPYSGRNFEYYSEDGYLSSTMAAAEVKGQTSKGLITYIKHFLLNDQETNRCGVSTFCNEQTFREIYLRGFEYAFTKGGSNAVMGGFNRIGCVWTGASKALMTTLLVDEWGFNGITDTDFALHAHMEARSGVMAGTTDFAVTNDARVNEILKDLETDRELYVAVRESAHRNLYTIVQSAEMNGLTANTKIVKVLTFWQIAFIVAIAIIGTAFALSTVLYVLHTYKKEEE